MARLGQILVPVSLSKRSRQAVAEAAVLARLSGAQLVLLHVAPPLRTAAQREDLMMRLAILAGTHAADLSVHFDVAEGDPVQEVLAFAAAYDVDLLVVGARHRSGVERALLESVGDQITREVGCSVLSVGPRTAETPAAPRLANVLCAVDLTDTSADTLGRAAGLARAAGARLTVVHTIDPWHWPQTPMMSAAALEATRLSLETSASDRLSALLSRYAGTGLPIDAVVSFGLTPPDIVRKARETRADVLVLGAHAGRALGRTILGPTPRYVLQNAPCPVLLARPTRLKPQAEDGTRDVQLAARG
jgi:nucleotide-binding universal stress UspA family protein